MTSHIVLSPHLDDAVLSCGQFLAAHPGTVVLTVCTATPTVVLSAYDQKCGFTSSIDAVAQRRDEDDRACTILRVTPKRLDVLDGQYAPIEEDGLVERLAEAERDRRGAVWIIPLGIGHPDHRAVSDAALTALGRIRLRRPVEVWIYEELPYRVIDPDEVYARLAQLSDRGWVMSPDGHGVSSGPMHLKQSAVACYRSQRLEWESAAYVPERFHCALPWPESTPNEEVE